MAGDWIKMRGNLWDDPRVTRLADETDQPEAMIVGGLYWLWATADQHSSDGALEGMTLRAIDRKTGIKGFGAALVLIGWLTENDDGVTVSRFEEHNGASAKTRLQTAKRVANHKGNAKVTQAPLPQAEQTVSDALPREEKRREEKKEPKSKANPAPAAPTFDAKAELIALDVEPQIAADWLTLRKTKRASVTPTVLKTIVAEAAKAGMPLNSALTLGCQRGWTGFEAAWVLQQARASPQQSAKFDPVAYVNRDRIL